MEVSLNSRAWERPQAVRGVTDQAIKAGSSVELRNPGCWSMLDLEKVQHRASYGLGFSPIGPKFAQEAFRGCWGTLEGEKRQPALLSS